METKTLNEPKDQAKSVESNNLNVISNLLKDSSYINVPDSKGNTPLFNAVDRNHKKLVKILLENGADINALSNNMTPLWVASNNDNSPIVNNTF